MGNRYLESARKITTAILMNPTLNRLSFFILGLAALAMSITSWSALLQYARRDNLEIIDWEVITPVVRQGGNFTYRASYSKTLDCPGQWTIRATSITTGHVYQVQSGRLGANPPGEYSVTWTIEIPRSLPPGEYELNEIVDGICDGGITFVERGPSRNLRVVSSDEPQD